MRCKLLGAVALAMLGLLVDASASRAQGLALKKLDTDGFGSLSGNVTLAGAIPDIVDLTAKMKANPDSACCLAPKAKPIEKIDQTWLIDPKTKAVQNVAVWVKPPAGTFFEIHPNYLKRKDTVVIDQPHCALLPRVSAFNPVYFDGQKMVSSGQQLVFKNTATVPHNVRAVGHPKYNKGFNRNMPPGTDLDALKDLKEDEQCQPQPLPIELGCGSHPWMKAQLFVFNHPYYAITDEKGNFEIPFVPAGAQVSIMAWHEGQGWVLTNMGTPMVIKKGAKHTLDFKVKAP